MNVSKKDLLVALQKALPGVEIGNTILEGADTFAFHNGFIHSYNDNISVSVPFSSEGKEELSGAVKAKDFYDLINRFSEDEIKIISKENLWILKSGAAKAEFSLMENSVVERIQKLLPQKKKVQKLPERFLNGLSFCFIPCVPEKGIAGIYVQDKIMVSTDKTRIDWFELDSSMETFWMSNSSAKELIKLSEVVFYWMSDSWIHFQSEDGVIFSCKKLNSSQYPFSKIQKIKEENQKEEQDKEAQLPKKLLDAINRASVMAEEIESWRTVQITFDSEGVEVYAERPLGKYTERVEWESPVDFPESLIINADYSMIQFGMKSSRQFYIKKIIRGEQESFRIIFVVDNGVQIVGTISKK